MSSASVSWERQRQEELARLRKPWRELERGGACGGWVAQLLHDAGAAVGMVPDAGGLNLESALRVRNLTKGALGNINRSSL